jgi:hypothetical protein
MQNSTMITRNDLLDRAKKFYFSLGVGDGASNLCRRNFRYGLAKLHVAQEFLGLEPNATFVSTPDETISRNKSRWVAGYGYGGKLVWNDKPDKLIFIDIKPNACGMLVGGLNEMPKPESIINNINRVVNETIYIDDMKLQWDFKKGNHFIDVFEVDNVSMPENTPKFMFVIHGSCPELRGPTEKGIGLYYDKSQILRDMMKIIDTPFGPICYIEGNNAREYMDSFLFAKDFAAKKREKAAELLFGPFTTICNQMHQGLTDYHEMYLGAHHVTEDTNELYPVMLRGDLTAYLVSAKRNLSEEQIDDLGFENRAKSQDVYHRLTDFNAIPHGGGYSFPQINRVVDVREIEGERYFVCEQKNQEAITIMTDPAELEYSYRGKSVINNMMATKLATIVAKLHPKFVLKV